MQRKVYVHFSSSTSRQNDNTNVDTKSAENMAKFKYLGTVVTNEN
jgi:hypothetical protein